MNTRKRTRASRKVGKPLNNRKQCGRIYRNHPVYSDWQIYPITYNDRVSYVSAPSDFPVPFCRAFAVAAAAGASFGSIAITRPYRVLIATVFDPQIVVDELAAITPARGWFPEKPVAVAKLIFHWDQIHDQGELGRVVKATEPELIVVEAGSHLLSQVRSRFGDSDAALLLPVDAPSDDPENIRLRIEQHDEKYQLTSDDGVILKMDRDEISFIPQGRARVIDVSSRVAAAKKTTIQEGANDE